MGDYVYSVFDGPFHFPLVGLLIAGIIGFIPFTRIFAHVFEWGLFRFIAKISYSIYLWHALVIVLLHKYIFGNTALSVEDWWKLSLSTVVITFIIAWGSQKVLEQGISGKLQKWKIFLTRDS